MRGLRKFLSYLKGDFVSGTVQFRKIALFAGLAVVSATAFAEEAPVGNSGHLLAIHVDPSLSEVNRKGPAVVHRPFALKNPNTGRGSEEKAKPISREEELTLPNGKKVQAGSYYDELNRFEQHVNQYGYSLRQGGEEVIPFSQLKVSQSDGSKEGGNRSEARSGKNPAKASCGSSQRRREAEAEKIPDFKNRLGQHLASHPTEQPKTFHDSKAWSGSWGWSNKIGAYLDASVGEEGSSERTSSNGQGNAGGYLFGRQLKIVRGVANFVTPKEGNLVGDVSFYFMGNKIFNKPYNDSKAFFYNTTWSKGLDESTTISFELGPIPMSAKLGARGDASLEFRMALLPLRANVDLVPGVHSMAYLQVNVNVVVGGAGGGSDLVLLDDSLTIVSNLQLLIDRQGPYFSSAMSADNEMRTLDGRVYAFVYVYAPRWGLPPWSKKQWDWDLFKMKGISARGSVFNKDDKVYLF